LINWCNVPEVAADSELYRRRAEFDLEIDCFHFEKYRLFRKIDFTRARKNYAQLVDYTKELYDSIRDIMPLGEKLRRLYRGETELHDPGVMQRINNLRERAFYVPLKF